MKRMKGRTLVLGAGALVVALAACGGDEPGRVPPPEDAPDDVHGRRPARRR